ncbi:hypothetical protein AMTRI_Chr05g73260 [Amborella trichopoda]
MELIPGLPYEIALACLIRASYDQFSVIKSVCKRWRDLVSSKEFADLRKSSGFSQNCFCLVQATQKRFSVNPKGRHSPEYCLSLYDLSAKKWEKMKPMPGFEAGIPLFSQVVSVGHMLVVLGGWIPATLEVSSQIFLYDLISGEWRRGKDIPEKCSFFACASDSDDRIFVSGGHDDFKNALASGFMYHVSQDHWERLPDMSRARDECRGVFARGKFHVFSGYRTESQGHFEGDVEAYDPDMCTWGPVPEAQLPDDTCPKPCMVGPTGEMYRCQRDGLFELTHGKRSWQQVAIIPEGARVNPYGLIWHGGVIVVGSGKNSGTQSWYTWRGENRWDPMELPDGYSGYVQDGCCIEI